VRHDRLLREGINARLVAFAFIMACALLQWIAVWQHTPWWGLFALALGLAWVAWFGIKAAFAAGMLAMALDVKSEAEEMQNKLAEIQARLDVIAGISETRPWSATDDRIERIQRIVGPS